MNIRAVALVIGAMLPMPFANAAEAPRFAQKTNGPEPMTVLVK